nr:hypothetical protein [Vulcanisaeta sp.]
MNQNPTHQQASTASPQATPPSTSFAKPNNKLTASNHRPRSLGKTTRPNKVQPGETLKAVLTVISVATISMKILVRKSSASPPT